MPTDEDYQPKSPGLRTLVERGYVEQASDLAGLDEALCARSRTLYIGFDPTASSIHVGNLLGVMLLRILQRDGHRPICLLGSATARVGDPSGKSETRKLLSAEQIEANAASMRRTFEHYLHFDSGRSNDALLLDNADWLLGLNYIDFLRDVGRHFTVNRMVAAKTYRDRLENEQALSFLEFNYQLLQAYDYLYLHREYECVLQSGGSDQWGNIIAGIELIRRSRHSGGGSAEAEADPCFALTTPLLTTADGRKMGKSERGALYLDPEVVSPFDFYQYWINCDDRDVARLLRLYTELPLEEIATLTDCEGQALNAAKARLALEATKLAHGEEAAAKAAEASRQAFGGGSADWSALTPILIEEPELRLVDLVVHEKVKGFKSKREARQRIESGAVRVDGEPVIDPSEMIAASSSTKDGLHLQVGKKHRFRIILGAT